MIKHTLDKVMATLEEVVKERGADYVYKQDERGQCSYVRDGEASCVVGKVIEKLDPELFEAVRVTEANLSHSWSVYDFGNTDHADTLPDSEEFGKEYEIPELPLSRQAHILLATAQTLQDTGDSYGYVLDVVKEKYERLVKQTETEYDEYKGDPEYDEE